MATIGSFKKSENGDYAGAVKTLTLNVKARITPVEKDMAKLLYPVDMSSFVRPEKDAKFRDVIILLQRQMGTQPTGILTSAEYDRLAQAARDIDHREIGLRAKTVVQTGDMLSARGTLTGSVANPLNTTNILCFRDRGTCEMVSATFKDDFYLDLDSPPLVYEIKTWMPGRITAISEGPCGTETMSIDVKAKEVALILLPHGDAEICSRFKLEAVSSTLVHGSPVTWKHHQDRVNKARELVYEPAKRLVPPVQDAQSTQSQR